MRNIFALLTCIGLATSAFGCGEATLMQSEKIYISPDYLQFSGTDMHIFLGEEWHPINSLFSDARGLFIYNGFSTGKSYYCSQCERFISCTRLCEHRSSPPSVCR